MSIKACYIHLPFSNHICGELNDSSLKYDFFHMESYIERLIKQIKKAHVNYEIIYIGGGNISLLHEKLLRMFLSFLSQFKAKELSIECNPNYLKEQEVLLFKKYGVNRIVLGIQKEKEKVYDPYNFKEAVSLLHKHHFYNLSFDIPFAFENQSESSFVESLENLISLNPKHIALYSEGASLDETLYFKSIDILSKYGFNQYEISNFAKEGYESKMNLVYYHHEDMHAFGLSSNFKVNGIRKTWTNQLECYLKEDKFSDIEILSKSEEMFETIMMGLRLKQGISLLDFYHKYNKHLLDVYDVAINQCKAYLEITETHLKVNKKGYHQLDDILIIFMESL